MIHEEARQHREELGLAEGAALSQSSQPEGQATERDLRRVIFRRYRELLQRIHRGYANGSLDESSQGKFIDRLKAIFVTERSEEELGYVFPEMPTVDEMRRAFTELRSQGGFDQIYLHGGSDHQEDWRLINGKLNGVIEVKFPSDRGVSKRLPVFDGQIVDTIPDADGTIVEITDCVNVQNIDGQLYGQATRERGDFSLGRYLPIIAGRLSNTVRTDNRETRIYGTTDFHIDPETREWSGVAELSAFDSYTVPVIRGEIRPRIDYLVLGMIKGADLTSIDDRGRFSGVIYTRDDQVRLIIHDEIRTTIHGQPIKNANALVVSPDGKISGFFELGERWVTVCEDQVLEHLSGDQAPEHLTQLRLVNSQLYGVAHFGNTSDTQTLPLVGNEIVETIDGKLIETVWNIHVYDDGTWDGVILFATPPLSAHDSFHFSKFGLVLRGIFHSAIDGKKIHRLLDVSSFDGTLEGLSGTVSLAGEVGSREYMLGEYRMVMPNEF